MQKWTMLSSYLLQNLLQAQAQGLHHLHLQKMNQGRSQMLKGVCDIVFITIIAQLWPPNIFTVGDDNDDDDTDGVADMDIDDDDDDDEADPDANDDTDDEMAVESSSDDDDMDSLPPALKKRVISKSKATSECNFVILDPMWN